MVLWKSKTPIVQQKTGWVVLQKWNPELREPKSLVIDYKNCWPLPQRDILSFLHRTVKNLLFAPKVDAISIFQSCSSCQHLWTDDKGTHVSALQACRNIKDDWVLEAFWPNTCIVFYWNRLEHKYPQGLSLSCSKRAWT